MHTDKVVTVLLIYQELCRTRVTVVNRLGQFDSVAEDSIANIVLNICSELSDGTNDKAENSYR